MAWVGNNPPGNFDPAASAIRAPVSAIGLAQPVIDLVHWLLARGQSAIWQGAYPPSINGMDSRIYHRPSPNCERVVLLALFEGSAESGTGEISITPDDGAGTEVSAATVVSTGTTTRYGDPFWQAAVLVADLVDTDEQYHRIVWSDLVVRVAALFEVPRNSLDPAVHYAVAHRDGTYAGFDTGRQITDGADAGLTDLLAAIATAKDGVTRHMGGILLPDASAWSLASSGAWANVADGSLGTSGFGFRHRSRQLDDDVSKVSMTARVRARYTGSGTGQLRLRGADDTLTFSSLTSSLAWYSGSINVSSDGDDEIFPEVNTTDGTTSVEVASIQLYE